MANQTASSNKPASSMAELMAKRGNDFQVLQKGQLVEGTIKKLVPGEILMDIGGKGDALVIEFDKQNMDNLLTFLKVGDRVTASVISPESEEGFPVLSLRRTLDDIIFKRFEELSKNDQVFEVDVVEATRGGYFAQTDEGIRGFLPASQVESSDNLAGQKINVKILEFDRPKKRVVFSEKAISYIMNPALIADQLKKGDNVNATVSNVTSYGLFVVVEPKAGVKIEGFVHISEIAYEHVTDLASKFKAGDKIKVQVIDVDQTNRRVNLSIKKTLEDVFATVREKYKVEDKIKGTVKDVKSRGVNIDLGDGISGLIPSDKIPSGATYNAGDQITAEVVDFDERRRLVILSPVLKAVPIGYR